MLSKVVALALLASLSCVRAQDAPAAGAAEEAAPAAESSSSQYWHERYHGILSMSAYGNYKELCPRMTFTREGLLKSFPDSTSEPWTMLREFEFPGGAAGYSVIIPEMDKVVVVFRGLAGWEAQDRAPAPINTVLNLGNCTDCTAHSGALNAYLEARQMTNNWDTEIAAATATGHQFSLTGHGYGGMLSQIMSLDLGWRGIVRWSHSHGSPRVFNKPAADLYNSLFGGEAGQRTVANDDVVPTIIPESADYTFALQGFHISGNGSSNATYGNSFVTCDYAEDANCLGGSTMLDHWYYYTPVGLCGGWDTQGNNISYAAEYQQRFADQFLAGVPNITSTAVASTSTSSRMTTSSVPVTTTTAAPVTAAAPTALPDTTQGSQQQGSSSSSSAANAAPKHTTNCGFALATLVLAFAVTLA